MTSIKLNSTFRILPFISFAVLVFIGLAIKASTSSFTHDESLSYIRFVFTSDPLALGDTNNHLLNSILMYGSSMLFGASEFTLRLPNLMSYLVYAYFTFKVLESVKNFEVRLLGYFMLNAIPFVLDFFALARGYGLALSLFMGHLYFLTRFINSCKPKYLFYALVMISLASVAVMTMIYFVVFVLAHSTYTLFSKRFVLDGATKRQIGLVITTSLIVVLFVYSIGSALQTQGAFFFGETSFLSSIETLARHTTYREANSAWWVLGFTMLMMCLFSAKIYIQGKREGFHGVLEKPFGLFASLVLFCVIEMAIQHVVLKTYYPPARAIQFYIPLFLLMLIYWLDQVPQMPRRLLTTSLALLVSLNFANGANLEHSLLWRYDSDTKRHYQFIAKQNDNRITVAAHPVYRPTFNFYNLINQTNIIIVQDANPQYFTDYVINVNMRGYDGYDDIANNGYSTLSKNKQDNQEWDEVTQYELPDTLNWNYIDLSDEFLILRKYLIPDMVTESAMVFVEFKASSPDDNLLTAHVVVTCSGDDVKPYYHGILAHHIQKQGDFKFSQGFWLSPQELSGQMVNIYIWNLDNQMFTVEDLRITWYRKHPWP